MALCSLEVLSHNFLEDILSFWFSHIDNIDNIIAPDVEDAMPWFSQDDAYDRACITNFGTQLEQIKSIEASGMKILSIARPSTPLHWISLIILLDQLPRNCYRGNKAGVAYRVFDKMALEIALRAIELGIPGHLPVRFRVAYSFWFFMPLEHAESLQMQQMVTEHHANLFRECEMLMDGSIDAGDTDVAHCRSVLLKRRIHYEKFKDALRGICNEHKDTIRLFGRYPRRNKVLNRSSTEAELAYLQEQS
ncbi:hypothetical protein BKA66DRAFT_542583 [Pyrenochaeta sp. MPI-SDFR-AT-0127]|nr:hypothetical protein BKA66DRAFT_542583 [Pyrenochaeta sp. MPI-SDFR-AT-0127]